MDTHQIQEAAKILNSCGYIRQDRGGLYVPLEKKFLLPMVLSANQSNTWTKQIYGETIWCMRAISSDQGLVTTTGVRINIQLPSGRFLFGGNGIDVGNFAWIGSWRFLLPEEQDIEPGSKLSVTLSDTTTGGIAHSLPVNLVFEGFYKYYFKGSILGVNPTLATQVPRYQGIVNENILAPSWMAGYGPEPPDGYEDEYFVYSIVPSQASPTATIALAGPLSATQTVTIDEDFRVRRVLADVEPGASVTAGSIMARLRTGDGYALMDDYLQIGRIAGAEWLSDWAIRGGDQVTADLALVDATGSGSVAITIHLEGVKRKRRAA